MKWLRLFFIVFLSGFVVMAIYLYNYLGLDKPVSFNLERRGPYQLAFKNHMGPYHQINSVIESVEKWANDNSLNCMPSFGEYYDDPAALDQDRLRSRGGCTLRERPKKPSDEIEFDALSEQVYLVARFAGAPSAGPLTVYPAAKEYIAEQRLEIGPSVIELYYINGEDVLTEYLWPVLNPPLTKPAQPQEDELK